MDADAITLLQKKQNLSDIDEHTHTAARVNRPARSRDAADRQDPVIFHSGNEASTCSELTA